MADLGQLDNFSSVNDATESDAFFDLVRQGRVEEVKVCLQTGLPAEILVTTEGTDNPLHVAVTQDYEEMVDMLLCIPDFITATNRYGETPLHLACSYGNLAYVKKLVSKGAELDAKDCAECSPLFHAVSKNQIEIVKLLIEAGCDLDTLNEELITPLDYAILHDKKEVISLLLKGGCAIGRLENPISYPDYWAYSIVFPLVGNADLKNIQLLVDCGYTTEYSQIRTMLHLLRKQYKLDDQYMNTFLKLVKQPQSLVGLCRISVRRVFHTRRYFTGRSVESMINKLDLPQKLKSYLAVSDS